MTLQILPILRGEYGTTDTTRDRAVLGVANTLRPTFSITEPLNGRRLAMRFAWSQTGVTWIQTLSTDTGEVIRANVPLVASGVDLWATAQFDARMPGGQLWIAWGDQQPRRPLRDSWRGEATLYYRPAELVGLVRGTARELY